MNEPSGTTGQDDRRAWIAVLARAPREQLALHAGALVPSEFEWLRQPETGLAMVRARVGNTGDRFNLGEVTITRCVTRHRDASGDAVAGVGYIKGRDAERARWVAMFDALLQRPAYRERLMRDVIGPLRSAIDATRAAEAARTAASRVRFFTLQSETA